MKTTVSTSTPRWYGIRTRSNCEKVAATALESKTYETYMPTYRSRRKWSDRTIEIERPLFPGYVFCRLNLGERLLPILTTPGVVSLIGFGSEPAAIPDTEIEAVKRMQQSACGAEPYPFVTEGERIRITGGSLKGLEGIVLKKRNVWRMIVSVMLLQRSISIEIDRESISRI